MLIITCADCGFGYVGNGQASSCPKCAAAAVKENLSTEVSSKNATLSSLSVVDVDVKPETRSSRRVISEHPVEDLESFMERLDHRLAEIEKTLARLAGNQRHDQPSISYLAVAALAAAFIMPIVAIILGHIAQREIRESHGYKYGDGMATAGLVLGYLGAVGIVIWIFATLTAVSQGY